MIIGYFALTLTLMGYADSPQRTEKLRSKSKIENPKMEYSESRVQRLKEKVKTKQELDQAKLSELKSIDLDRLKEEAKKLQNQGK